MIEPSKHIHPQMPREGNGAAEIERTRDEVSALLRVAMKAAAARAVDLLQPPARDEPLARLLDCVKQDLAQAKAELAARGPQAAREDSRFACDALALHRVCARAACRRAQSCRGNPVACYGRARVPEPAREWAVRMLLAQRMPWLPLLAEHAANRAVYDAWIAGIEAGRA